jgi:predicted TIM-barrel fold metal-dependent hydrolase
LIIDAHNHVGGPDKGDHAKQSPKEIVATMDKVGIDKAVIFPFNEINLGISFSLANDYIASAMKRYPDRLIGFAFERRKRL